MKIGPLESNASATAVAAERKTQGSVQAAGSQAEPSAHVELSSALLAGATAEGSFDAEKVERIAQAIKDGKFKVNPEAIADKLIANAQELLGKTAS